jgi:nodulation protein E
MNRVVITGVGVASPVGHSPEQFWSALIEPRSGVRALTVIPTERLSARIAAQIDDFDAAAHFDSKLSNQLDRFAQFALYAAREAFRSSGLVLSEELALSAATIVGNGAGGQTTTDEAYHRLHVQNASRIHPLSVPRFMGNAAGSQIAIDLGLKGPGWTVASACASATHAIGQAFHMVRSGQAAIAMTGGAEAPLTFGNIKAWEALRVLTADTCRPFSRTRSGVVLGEGAAMFVLERRDDAVRRGAPILAELLGFGMSTDAVDIVAADAGGAARAIVGALADAKLNCDDIDYVNAHGTGTVLNDKTESEALRRVFGDHAQRLAVSSSKAVLGHSLGAAGALELAATVLALKNQVVPPTANFQEPDPDCALDFVPNVARQAPIRHAISNSFAFGGLNAVLALGRG